MPTLIWLVLVPHLGELPGPQIRRLTEVQFYRGAFRRLYHQAPAHLLVSWRVGYQEILEVQVLFQVKDAADFFLADPYGKIFGVQFSVLQS